MKPIVTFVIPVRHFENSTDWPRLKQRLSATIASIAGQTSDVWQCVIVANEGSDLPELPAKFDVKWVDFPPNKHHDLNNDNVEVVYDHFRLDKGRRVLAGMLSVPSQYYMIVDDDDFVSNKIVQFVSDNEVLAGWKISKGYVWGSGGSLLKCHNDFSSFCGTSLIIKSEAYNLPKNAIEADENYVKNMLGSHVKIEKILLEKGLKLEDLPFRGAVYRVGHAGAHSLSRGILADALSWKRVRRPKQWLRDLLHIRVVTPSIEAEFSQGSRLV
jgi:hypothetical protein